MRLEIPYSYSPNLTLDASKLLPNGSLELPGTTHIDIPELAAEDAPVAALITNASSGRKSSWRRQGSRWFVPLALTPTMYGPAEKAVDVRTLATMAKAGFVAGISGQEGLGCLMQSGIVQAGTAGKAMLELLERQNPRNPGSGQNRNIIDSGNWKSAEASAVSSWRKLGIVAIGGEAWQTVGEPVILLGPVRIEVLPMSARPVAESHGPVYMIDEWDDAAAQWEKTWGRRPVPLVELAEPAASPKP